MQVLQSGRKKRGIRKMSYFDSCEECRKPFTKRSYAYSVCQECFEKVEIREINDHDTYILENLPETNEVIEK